jgi:hypothetical protein
MTDYRTTAERERDNARFELQGMEVRRCKDNEYLLQRIAALEKALEYYGEHARECGKGERTVTAPGKIPICTCGFDAALEGKP